MPAMTKAAGAVPGRRRVPPAGVRASAEEGRAAARAARVRFGPRAYRLLVDEAGYGRSGPNLLLAGIG